MFQKNFLGVKYLTQNFQKKRHLAASAPSAPVPAARRESRLRRASNKLENQRQYRIHNRRRKNPLRRTVLV